VVAAARRLWIQFLESGQQTQTHGRWDHMPGWLAGRSRRNGGFNGKIILKIGDYPMPRLSTAGYHIAFLRVMFIHLIYLLSMSRNVIGVARSKHILLVLNISGWILDGMPHMLSSLCMVCLQGIGIVQDGFFPWFSYLLQRISYQ